MNKKSILISVIYLVAQFTFAQTEQSKAFTESYQYEYKKDYANAISALDKIYEANSYEVNLRLGWLSYLNADFPKSQAYYKTAIKLQPSSIEAKLGYAYPTSAMQNWEDILKIYNDVLAIDKNNYTVNYRMAVIYFLRKDFEKANMFATKISKLYPFDFKLNILLGKINIGLGKINNAKIYLSKALLYNPSSNTVLSLLKSL
jgi:tetratricopeptide (TPR) repeat protein